MQHFIMCGIPKCVISAAGRSCDVGWKNCFCVIYTNSPFPKLMSFQVSFINIRGITFWVGRTQTPPARTTGCSFLLLWPFCDHILELLHWKEEEETLACLYLTSNSYPWIRKLMLMYSMCFSIRWRLVGKMTGNNKVQGTLWHFKKLGGIWENSWDLGKKWKFPSN